MSRRLAKRTRRNCRSAAFYSSVLAAASIAVATAAYAADAPQVPIYLQADQIVYDAKSGMVTASGHVEIADDQRILRADTITYNQSTDAVDASGHVSLLEPDGTIAFADSVELTGDLREGAMHGFSALIGKTGRLGAVSAARREGRYTEATGAVFTPCIICAESGDTTPVWQIKALRVIHDQLAQELTFQNATLEFLGMPVLFLPVFSEPDPTVKHKTGLLLPVIGSSSNLGSFVRVPYYISLGPSSDVTLEPYVTTNSGTVLQGEYRQRWDDGGVWLQGSLGYDGNATRQAGTSLWMSHLFGSGSIPFADIWRAGFDVQLTSNDTYLRRFDISPLDRLTSDLFVDSVVGRSRASVTSYFFQSLRAGDAPGTIPLVLPLAEYTYIPERKIYGGRLRVDTSALALTRSEGTDMYRASTSADWLRSFTSDSGQVFTAEAMGRGDLYYITDAKFEVPTAPRNTETIGRGLGFAALEWRWPMVSEDVFRDTNFIVEPIAQLVAATQGGNPAGLPNEDSTSSEFGVTNLFSPNELPGLDLWTGGSRSNIGVRATAFLPQGSIEATLGQDFRTSPDPNFAPSSGLGGERSDIVGRIKISLKPNIDLVQLFRYNPEDGTLRQSEVYLKASFGASSVDLSYLKLAQDPADPTLGPRQEINLTATIGIYRYWGLFAATTRDLELGRNIVAGGGFKYEDECFMAQLGFQRRDTTDRDLRPSSSIILRLGLKTGLTGESTP